MEKRMERMLYVRVGCVKRTSRVLLESRRYSELVNKPWLFFAPRSSETSRENFLATLESGYPIEEVRPYLTEEELQSIGNRQSLYIWGNQKAKQPSWEKMNIRDWVAFYAKGEFVYVGKCILKKQSEELARNLWGSVPDKEDENITWEFIFFLDEIRPIQLPLKVVQQLADYEEKMIVQGFMPINEKGMDGIINNYGSLTSFFDAHSTGLQTKDFAELEEASSRDSTEPGDLEKIDEIFNKGNPNVILKEFEQRLSGKTPEVIETKVKRVKRNRTIVEKMKEKYENKCQICGFTFQKKDGTYYSEVTHIKPIKTRDRGVDAPSNLMVMCPNHHKMHDLGSLKIVSTTEYEFEIDGVVLKEPLFCTCPD